MLLRQSTIQTVRFGPFVDDTDGATLETALTIAQADRLLSKDGAAFAQSGTTGNATADGTTGYYSADLSATDTNTCGELILSVKVAGALAVRMRWYVVEEAVYDALYASGATGLLPANVTQLAGVTQSLTDLKDLADAGYDPTTHKIQSVASVDINVDMRGTDNAALDATVAKAADAALEATAQSILTDTGTTIPAQLDSMSGATFDTATDSLEAIRDRGDAAWVTESGGSGGVTHVYTLTDSVDSLPIQSCLVWVTSDEAGLNFLYSDYTNEFGTVTFNFTVGGTYYFWRRKAGVYFENPDTEVVS